MKIGEKNMHWTSRDEKGILKEWAKELKTPEIVGEVFPEIDFEVKSYFEKCGNENDIEEYSFDIVPELKKILEYKLNSNYEKEIIAPVMAATFRGKRMITTEQETEKTGNKDFDIPEYVYVF